MSQVSDAACDAPTYIISRTKTDGRYSVWKLNTALPELFEQVHTKPDAKFAPGKRLCSVGGYMLAYDLGTLGNSPPVVSYELFLFHPERADPLNGPRVKAGDWPKQKFWQYRSNFHFTWNPDDTDFLQLVPITGYVLAYMPTAARATYKLHTFDPDPDGPVKMDPLPSSLGPQDAFSMIGKGSALLPVNNYVLEWVAATSTYRVWNFDPQEKHPLQLPYMSQGKRPDIAATHKLVVLGHNILQIDLASSAYQLWGFDPALPDPFVGPLRTGTLPQGFDADTDLTATQTAVPIDRAAADTPGSMDFMRKNIDHVVVYMLESRTMDSVLGWLYDKNPPDLNFVNAEAPFKGNSLSNGNEANGKTFHPYVFEEGKLSDQVVLAAPSIDPFHATSDCVRQQFSGGFASYLNGDAADMGGFVASNQSAEAMVTFSPEQLPVLHGLASHFAVSDYWFSAMPGGTIANRGYALSGSNYNVIVNCEGNPYYENFSINPLRQPIWKVLQNNGITDWKIYYSVKWQDAVFTYQLYLRNQLPSVDANLEHYVKPLEDFFTAVKAGALPKFTFLEPAWIAPNGATSYHPGASGDMVPAEMALNEIYEALSQSPQWDRTALIITFSKGGGLYDHEPTPATRPGWPQDTNDGFSFDVLGPRVPAIIVSPLVKPSTVFRSGKDQPFESVSILSTVLEWCGVPRARWGLGDRVPQAPTFEAVFELKTPRTDMPSFTVPYDKSFPKSEAKG